MRSWKSSVLLATVGLSGLGALFAQDAPLPIQAGATPVIESVQPLNIVPRVNTIEPTILAPVPESHPPVEYTPESPVIGNSPVMHDSWVSGPAPAPQYMPAPFQSGCCGAVAGPAPGSSCGCQGGSMMSGGFGNSGGAGYGNGSGVSSGVLSPNANSGGLHTRYPYYNYRHPWYYQGPPSQNVTILW